MNEEKRSHLYHLLLLHPNSIFVKCVIRAGFLTSLPATRDPPPPPLSLAVGCVINE